MEKGESTRRDRVVVVGGGVAGALLAKTLQSHADVVLIDPKEYFEIPWAQLRSRVEPSFAERAVVNHSEYLTNGRIITSSAVDITESEVVLAEGHTVLYDYLIVATGHTDSVPIGRAQRLEQFQAENEKIKSARSVLVIGGGPTGVELAGEIAVDFPEKKVTLVHRGSRLLDFLGSKASSKTLDWLTSKNVDVLLDQYVTLDDVEEDCKTFDTSGGETVAADCHFLCVGRPLGSSWMEGTILETCLDSRGRLMVDEYLRVKGKKNVFAIGDITDVPEIKQGFYAQKHAFVTANNIKQLIKGGKESKMSTYKPGKVMAIVSLGRKEAVAQFPLVTTIGCIPGLIKSKDLFVGKTRKQMGLDSRSSSLDK